MNTLDPITTSETLHVVVISFNRNISLKADMLNMALADHFGLPFTSPYVTFCYPNGFPLVVDCLPPTLAKYFPLPTVAWQPCQLPSAPLYVLDVGFSPLDSVLAFLRDHDAYPFFVHTVHSCDTAIYRQIDNVVGVTTVALDAVGPALLVSTVALWFDSLTLAENAQIAAYTAALQEQVPQEVFALEQQQTKAAKAKNKQGQRWTR